MAVKLLRLARTEELHPGVVLRHGADKALVVLLPGVELLETLPPGVGKVLHQLGVVRPLGVINLVMEAPLLGQQAENQEQLLPGAVAINQAMEVLLPGVVTREVSLPGVAVVINHNDLKTPVEVPLGVTINRSITQERDPHGAMHPNTTIAAIDLLGVIRMLEVVEVRGVEIIRNNHTSYCLTIIYKPINCSSYYLQITPRDVDVVYIVLPKLVSETN